MIGSAQQADSRGDFMARGNTADPRLLSSIPEDVGPRGMAFRGGAVHSIRPPGSQNFFSTGHAIGVCLRPVNNMTVALGSDRLVKADVTKGSIAIQPAGLDGSSTWSSNIENLVTVISAESLQELAASEFDRLDFELRPTMPAIDRTALKIATLMKEGLDRPEFSNELYLDSLITLLGLHVLRRYSSIAIKPKGIGGGLSPTQASRVREYVEEHLTRKIAISELAAQCGLSPGYFISAFTKTFGVPPHRFLVECRIEFAERLLAETEMSIPEVAYLSGFSSQSHLTSTMKKYRNMTPLALRQMIKAPRQAANN